MNFTPSSRSFNNLRQDETAHFSGLGQDDSTPPQACSDADKSQEGKAISDRLSAGWRKKIEGERARVMPVGVAAEASLSPIEYQSAFPRGCKVALVTLTYEWRLKTSSPTEPAKILRVPKTKSFGCVKVFGSWSCTY
jgi:hypothetical protein